MVKTNDIFMEVKDKGNAEFVVKITGLALGERIDIRELSIFLSQINGIKFINKRGGEAVKIRQNFGLDGNGIITADHVVLEIENLETECERADYNFSEPRPSMLDYPLSQTEGRDSSVNFEGKAILKCIVGGILLQFLHEEKIYIYSHIRELGGIRDRELIGEKNNEDRRMIRLKNLRVYSDDAGKAMLGLVRKNKEQKNSLGGIIDCLIEGLPAGVGRCGSGIDADIARCVFGIPDVKGVEFGSGFASAKLTGIETNDGFCMRGRIPETITTNDGGVVFGLTNGMAIDFAVAFRPTPLIGMKQYHINLETYENSLCSNKCGSETCFILKACPIVEGFTAVVLYEKLKNCSVNIIS